MKHMRSGRMGSNPNTRLVIQLPDSRVLRVLSRSVFVVLVILALPCILTILRGSPSESYNGSDSMVDYSKLLNSLFRHFAGKGLLRNGVKALIISPGGGGIVGIIQNLQHWHNNVIDVVMDYDLKGQSSIPDETFDFVFTPSFSDTNKFVNRVLKIGGIVAVPLSEDPSNIFPKHSNYRIVYLCHYETTIMAMRKVMSRMSLTKRPHVCQMASEAKKAMLENLEDVLLEPPRTKHLKKFNFLPDLLGDNLEGYNRRVFIDVGLADEENTGVTEWFHHNYPKRNQEFEVYNLVTEPEEGSSGVDASDWLVKNVKEEEYVVMKAEAEVVEEMMKRRTICLVDEVFLECRNNWWQGVGGKYYKSKRAYWECLALYGRLRDEGVAVHQWWG
ncbi:uncharacterized protein LOC132177785 [Corylus avellana]|uniref:uncharacterized protein LOC132177785 n=1 Tax=Corylus avellana TaxID=13451 RepID=UPI00286D498B|nr:uncharacterized protein LOC132177785 [Corylus avellana]